MKKIQISISDDAHLELLGIQFQRKVDKNPKTTLIEIASDVLEEKLLEIKANKKASQK